MTISTQPASVCNQKGFDMTDYRCVELSVCEVPRGIFN